jgi:hypothetical protein
MLFAASGCVTEHRYEIDLSKVKDFEWNGQLRITQRYHGLFEGWKVDHIELFSADDTAVAVNTADREPTVYLIGEPSSHEPAKVLVLHSAWFAGHPEEQTHLFRKREDWGDSVDSTCSRLKHHERRRKEDGHEQDSAS